MILSESTIIQFHRTIQNSHRIIQNVCHNNQNGRTIHRVTDNPIGPSNNPKGHCTIQYKGPLYDPIGKLYGSKGSRTIQKDRITVLSDSYMIVLLDNLI